MVIISLIGKMTFKPRPVGGEGVYHKDIWMKNIKYTHSPVLAYSRNIKEQSGERVIGNEVP